MRDEAIRVLIRFRLAVTKAEISSRSKIDLLDTGACRIRHERAQLTTGLGAVTVQALVLADAQNQLVLRRVEHVVHAARVRNVVLLSYQLVVILADQELGDRAILHAHEQLLGALVDAEAGRGGWSDVAHTDREFERLVLGPGYYPVGNWKFEI